MWGKFFKDKLVVVLLCFQENQFIDSVVMVVVMSGLFCKCHNKVFNLHEQVLFAIFSSHVRTKHCPLTNYNC